MKTLHFSIIVISGIVMIVSIDLAFADNTSVMLTPFDISFPENDFNKTGISHYILILKPNQTAAIHVIVTNNDNILHQIQLQVPAENRRYFVSSYSFESPMLIINPHASNQTILHITAENINDTQTGYVFILATDSSFGMKSKGFYLAIGNDIPDAIWM